MGASKLTSICPECKRPVKYYIGNEEVEASRMKGTDRLCSVCYNKLEIEE